MRTKRLAALAALCLCITAGCGRVDSETGDAESSGKTKSTAETTVTSAAESETTSGESAPEDSSSASDSVSDDSSRAEKKGVKKAYEVFDTLSPIPEGADSEIFYMGYIDPNSSTATSTDMIMNMFKSCGGSVKFEKFTSTNSRYDELAKRLISAQDVPDIISFDYMAFPNYAVKGLYQPIDSIVDFDSELWAETKDTADKFSLGGEHYVAPLHVSPTAVVLYRKDIIEDSGLDDPYDLYLDGKWNRAAFSDMIEKFCSSDSSRYGVNGFYSIAFMMQTGKGIVSFDGDSFANNMDDKDMKNAVDFLYDIDNKGLVNHAWQGSAEQALDDGDLLFYIMGTWSMTDSSALSEGDYGLVPVPAENADKQCNVGDVASYLWVSGSDKSDAVRTWLECCRTYETADSLREYQKENFLAENEFWTEEMYEITAELSGFSKPVVSEYLYGLSAEFTTIDQEKGASISNILTDPTTPGYNPEGKSWAELQNEYSWLIDEYIADYNNY